MKFLFLTISTFLVLACHDETTTVKFPDGGIKYPPPNDSVNSNFHWLPLSDSITRADSFGINIYDQYFFASFNEPNLSLKDLPEILFRFSYLGARKPFIINLTQNEIILKQAVQGSPYPDIDEDQLKGIEKENYLLLKNNFPLTKKSTNPKHQQYIDSVVKLYPELLDPLYYRHLLIKCMVRQDKFFYTTKTIPISETKFRSLVNLINATGYWSGPRTFRCQYSSTDGDAYFLEANTEIKYNIVFKHSCDVDTSKLTKVCQEIINCSQLDLQL